MDSTQTLHDFVLNLLTNPDARSAFELDPEGTLRSAGLGDLTPADVQDVVPLVVDYVPVQGLTNLDAVGGLGLGELSPDVSGLVGHVQSTVEQVTVAASPTSADVNVATLGAITVDPVGLGVGASLLSDIGVGVSPSGVGVDVSGAYDVAGTLDAEVLEPVTTDAVGTVGGTVDSTVGIGDDLVGGVAPDGLLGTADLTLNTVTGTLDTATNLVNSLDVGGLGQGLGGTQAPVVGDLDAARVVGGVTGTVDNTLDGVGVGNVTGSLGLSAGADASAGTGGLLDLGDGLL
ncbi:IniB N-terminal domain-containing protein [Solwaraspora sp. WMMD1047]|uniref:IniB N-terminal domain-containing protein n=1 Tax=Solwaraspora sp. WMMD1047 TaxID=3016102 RepID=UPI002415CAA6|nr:IniB N-terminal domain-containing protein [Solwaraspora sp. WMMD1047]MDG4834648.1 IniB N-terminal domain-containing protein [Solwaraspora sp. WMMD1047]